MLDKQETLALLRGFLNDFQNCINQDTKPVANHFDKYLDPHFQVISNGRAISNGLTEYLKRVAHFQQRYSHCEIHLKQEDLVWGDNRLACHYHANLTDKNGQRVQIYMMVIATIEQDKFRHWTQVSHEEGTGQWEK